MDYAYHSKLVLACSLASSLSTFFREATSKIKCEFSNGSLCRPSDSYFTYCSWLATLNCLGEQRLASRMHSTFLYMVTHGCEVDPMQMMRFEALDDTHAVRKMMCLSLKCTRVTQLLLLLVSWFQQKDISFDSYCFLLIGLHHCGGLLSVVSRYHKLIELLISLQVQRSSTGLVLNS
ncbi:unnamed protein product [Brassica oleracea var. botrytis]